MASGWEHRRWVGKLPTSGLDGHLNKSGRRNPLDDGVGRRTHCLAGTETIVQWIGLETGSENGWQAREPRAEAVPLSIPPRNNHEAENQETTLHPHCGAFPDADQCCARRRWAE